MVIISPKYFSSDFFYRYYFKRTFLCMCKYVLELMKHSWIFARLLNKLISILIRCSFPFYTILILARFFEKFALAPVVALTSKC